MVDETESTEIEINLGQPLTTLDDLYAFTSELSKLSGFPLSDLQLRAITRKGEMPSVNLEETLAAIDKYAHPSRVEEAKARVQDIMESTEKLYLHEAYTLLIEYLLPEE